MVFYCITESFFERAMGDFCIEILLGLFMAGITDAESYRLWEVHTRLE